MHFALVFPGASGQLGRTDAGRAAVPILYMPAVLLACARAAALLRGRDQGAVFTTVITLVERGEMIYLAVG
jgi:hypothetical protein